MKQILQIVIVTSLLLLTTLSFLIASESTMFLDPRALNSIFAEAGFYLISLFIATLFTSYLVTACTDMNVRFRYLAIPIWLWFSASMIFAVDRFFGYAYPALPPQAELISYRAVYNPETKTKNLETWMYLKDQYKTRSYVFPYSAKLEDALYKAMRMKAAGKKVLVELDDDTGPSSALPEDMITYDMHSEILPSKNYQGDEATISEHTNRTGLETEADVVIKVPGGGDVRVQRGQIFRVDPTGELEMIEPLDPRWGRSHSEPTPPRPLPPRIQPPVRHLPLDD